MLYIFITSLFVCSAVRVSVVTKSVYCTAVCLFASIISRWSASSRPQLETLLSSVINVSLRSCYCYYHDHQLL